MKRILPTLILATVAALAVLGQIGCGSKDASSDAVGSQKNVNNGQNRKTGEAPGFVNPK